MVGVVMDKYKIIYFDHNPITKVAVVPKLRKIIALSSFVEIETELDKDACAHIKQNIDDDKINVVIVHINDKFESVVNEVPDTTIILRVSTVGCKELSHPKSGKPCCLFLRKPHGELSEDEWRYLLATLQNAEKVKRIIDPKNLYYLYPYFGECPPVVDLLYAIAILCQGYLVSDACSVGKQADAIQDEVINNALHEMGYTGNISSTGDLKGLFDRAGQAFLQNDNYVRSMEWWNLDVPELEELFSTFFKDFHTEGRDITYSNLIQLAGKIDQDNQVDDPALVAGAYLESKKILQVM